MEFFRIKRDIPFMRYALVLNVISFVTFALAVFFLITPGSAPVDRIHRRHGAGSRVHADRRHRPHPFATVEALGFGEVQVQNFGTSRDVLIRVPIRGDVKQSEVAATVLAALCKAEIGHGQYQAVHHAARRTGQPPGLRHGRRHRAPEAEPDRVRRPVGRIGTGP